MFVLHFFASSFEFIFHEFPCLAREIPGLERLATTLVRTNSGIVQGLQALIIIQLRVCFKERYWADLRKARPG